MKKVFYPRSFAWLFIILIMIVFTGGGIWLFIDGIQKRAFKYLIVGGVWSCFILYYLCLMCTTHISFETTGIFCPEDKGSKKGRVQYKTKVAYSDIKNISLVLVLLEDSKGRKMSIQGYSSFRENLFFEFTLSALTKERLEIFYYSKRQRKKMLEIINEKLGTHYDYDVMWAECQARIKEKKRKRKEKRKIKNSKNKTE